jgi:hypothetical protein
MFPIALIIELRQLELSEVKWYSHITEQVSSSRKASEFLLGRLLGSEFLPKYRLSHMSL